MGDVARSARSTSTASLEAIASATSVGSRGGRTAAHTADAAPRRKVKDLTACMTTTTTGKEGKPKEGNLKFVDPGCASYKRSEAFGGIGGL